MHAFFFFAESRDGHHQFILIVADLLVCGLKKKENKKNHHDHLSGVYIHARRPQLQQLQAVAVKYTIQKKE